MQPGVVSTFYNPHVSSAGGEQDAELATFMVQNEM
jgi:hypothetical protein